MDMLEILDAVDVVRDRLEALNIEFGINIMETHDNKGSIALVVTWGETIFDKHIETLDSNFDVEAFMDVVVERLEADMDVIFTV